MIYTFSENTALIYIENYIKSNELDNLKPVGLTSGTYKEIIKKAESFSTFNPEDPKLVIPIAVTDKEETVSGNKHNYESIAGNYHPDPSDPTLPYISKDGIESIELDKDHGFGLGKYDNKRITNLSVRCENLAKAFYLTKNLKYYDCLCKLLNVWFLDDNTYMYPNMEHAAYIPNKKNKYGIEGEGQSMMEADSFIPVLEAIMLADYIYPLDENLKLGLVSWFTTFGEWTINSDIGKKTRGRNNNQTIIYDKVLLFIAIFTGDIKLKNDVIRMITSDLNKLISNDGRMPNELRRTKAFTYSIYCLEKILDIYTVLKNSELILSEPARSRIIYSASYIDQFVGNRQNFLYDEIGDWNSAESKFAGLKIKMESLGLWPIRSAKDIDNSAYDELRLGEWGNFRYYTF